MSSPCSFSMCSNSETERDPVRIGWLGRRNFRHHYQQHLHFRLQLSLSARHHQDDQLCDRKKADSLTSFPKAVSQTLLFLFDCIRYGCMLK